VWGESDLPLSVDGDADPGTPTFDGTSAAEGGDRPAKVLAERDQQVVVIDPVPLRQLPPEAHLGLLGCLGRDVPPAVRDPVDMRIDADPRLLEAHRHDEIGGLSTHPLETEELFETVGHAPGEAGQEGPGDLADGSGFGSIETHRVDRPRYPPFAEREDRLRPIGEAIQSRGCHLRHLILGLLAQDARDQDPKRVVRRFGDLV